MSTDDLRRTPSRRSALGAALAVGALTLSGCSDDRDLAAASTASLTSTAVTLYGDSITTGNGTNAIHVTMTENPDSWPHYLGDSPVTLADITALNGITAEDILPYAQTATSDVLLLELGANDLLAVNEGMNLDETLAWFQKSISLLVERTGKSGKDVIMTAIGPRPSDQAPEQTDPFNAAMKAWSTSQKFWWTDPWPNLKGTTLGAYKDGLSDDGVHPNAAGAPILGAAYRSEIERVLRERARV
jgi:lysophospholipase L1-like esterase